MQLQRGFSDYYGETQYNEKTKNETIETSGNFYVHNTIFSNHFQNRAIYLNLSSKVLLETCTFYNNSSTERGGSFFIKDSDCVLVHICCSFSSTTEWGCGYYIDFSKTTTKKNYAFESSVSSCSGFGSAFYHFRGYIQVSNMNSSNHKITYDAAYVVQYPTETGIVNLTTAFNTSSEQESGIIIDGTFNITKCNYLNNTYTGSRNGIIKNTYSTCTFSDCSFMNNKGNNLFYKKPNIIRCYFKDNSVDMFAYYYSGSFESGDPLDSFIPHYSYDKCFDSNIFNQRNNHANLPNFEGNHIRTYYEYERDKFGIDDVKQIALNAYKTSFVEIINLPGLI